jgi:hypothetical protein
MSSLQAKRLQHLRHIGFIARIVVLRRRHEDREREAFLVLERCGHALEFQAFLVRERKLEAQPFAIAEGRGTQVARFDIRGAGGAQAVENQVAQLVRSQTAMIESAVGPTLGLALAEEDEFLLANILDQIQTVEQFAIDAPELIARSGVDAGSFHFAVDHQLAAGDGCAGLHDRAFVQRELDKTGERP